MKTCFKCHAVKPLFEYYKHPQMADGHLGKCKECTKADTAARHMEKMQDIEWVESELARQRTKAAKLRSIGLVNPVSTEKKMTYLRRQRLKFPEKYRARGLVATAINKGSIIPEPCFCGAKAQAHHEDYSKPLEVQWLCTIHHNERHVELRRIARLAKAVA